MQAIPGMTTVSNAPPKNRDLIIQSWLNLWATLYKESSDIKCLENSPGLEKRICIKLTILLPLLPATPCDLRGWWGSELILFWTARNQQDIPRHQPSFRVASNSRQCNEEMKSPAGRKRIAPLLCPTMSDPEVIQLIPGIELIEIVWDDYGPSWSLE